MEPGAPTVRRATIDDRAKLIELWKRNHLPGETLDQRFTEFQLVESPQGELLGAIGLQICDNQGHLHSEAFHDFGLSDKLRPLLWERMRSVAKNHGLVRLWTSESAPFWQQNIFSPPAPELAAKLPPAFGDSKKTWGVMKLREESGPAALSIEQHLDMFKRSQQEESAQRFRQARVLKTIATVIAVLLFLLVFGGVFYLLKNKHRLPQQR